MNEFLDSRWSESVRRLALGVELTDPMRGMRIGFPLEVRIDGPPLVVPWSRRGPAASPWEEPDARERLARHDSCRHVLQLREEVGSPVAIRVVDPRQRFVPRRFEIELPDPIGAGRAVRPALFPGSAYPIPAGAFGVRGRVERDGEPMRWARVEARRTTDDALVGRAHGDQHGEFVLLLDAEAARGADLILPLEITVAVFGPDTAPDPGEDSDSAIDPLWDLPLEDASLGVAGEEVLAGERLPDGYVSRPNSVREVELSWHGLVREEFDFS